MKTILAFCIALLGFSSLYSQYTPPLINDHSQPTPPADSNTVYTIVQQKPEFPGDINTWLANNIVYPNDAKMNNIQGTVYVSFIVERNGSVSSGKVMRGVQGGKMLDDEALRVVSIMPTWTPGHQNGHTVRVAYMVPIHFMLADGTPPSQKQN